MIRVFDNGGKTIDRYTVIWHDNIYYMSENPGHPQGVNQYAGVFQATTANVKRLGKEITLDSLPRAVLLAIIDRLGD